MAITPTRAKELEVTNTTRRLDQAETRVDELLGAGVRRFTYANAPFRSTQEAQTLAERYRAVGWVVEEIQHETGPELIFKER